MSKSKYLDLKRIRDHARELRKNMTDSEKLLWDQLRNRKLCGYKFLRQHPIIYKANYKGLNYFIADFYCDEKKAVIEVDGPVHLETTEYDQFRDMEIKGKGIKVLRIKNEEIEEMDDTIQKIKNFLNAVF